MLDLDTCVKWNPYHFGLRKGEKIEVLLSNGLMDRKSLKISKINKTIKVKQ